MESSERATFRAVTQMTEGMSISLLQAWHGRGTCIQHDLDDDASMHNPVVDFLHRHGQLKLSSVWLRIERWIEDRIGSIARRPAFITSAAVHSW